MSWEAVTWANNQALKKSYEQVILLVLANVADPNGEAFVKWPGRDHWWVYLSKKTRLPKSSLFRHLNTIVALGLGERSMQVLADGSRRPTFKLNMAASFDIDRPEDEEKYRAVFAKTSSENQSPVGTEHDDDFEGDEINSDISGSHGDETPAGHQSPVGTGNAPAQSPVGTDPFPVLGLQEDSLPVPKNSPLPPSGGLNAQVDEDWEKFVTAWGEPIPKFALARSAWDHVPTVQRGEAVVAARGYRAQLEAERRARPKSPPSAVSAQAFLRDTAGWAQWLRYAPAADGTAPPLAPTTVFAPDSTEGRALKNLYAVGRARVFETRAGIVYPLAISPRVLAFAEIAPQAEWLWFEDGAHIARWSEFIGTVVHGVRSPLVVTRGVGADAKRGIWVPHPWPPNKNGDWGKSLMSAEDEQVEWK